MLFSKYGPEPSQVRDDGIGEQERGAEREPHVDDYVAGGRESGPAVEEGPRQTSTALNDREVGDHHERESWVGQSPAVRRRILGCHRRDANSASGSARFCGECVYPARLAEARAALRSMLWSIPFRKPIAQRWPGSPLSHPEVLGQVGGEIGMASHARVRLVMVSVVLSPESRSWVWLSSRQNS